MTAERYFIATDLEGVVGVDSFTQTRSTDAIPELKDQAMARLAAETNACIEGIRSISPDAEIDVLDGHGPGGLYEDDLEGGRYLRRPDFEPYQRYEYDAALMVGRHAMAGMAFAPLRHTQSSTSIEYYKLNGTFIGEIAGGGLKAGYAGVPLVYVSGDDKAVAESKIFIPNVNTTITKYGTGVESAEHRDGDVVLDEIREDARNAVSNAEAIDPLNDFEPPFRMEIRFTDPDPPIRARWERPEVERSRIDDRTILLESDTYRYVYP